MASLSDLLKIPTKTEVLDQLVALARLTGFPTASWHPLSLSRHLFEAESSYLSDLTTLIGNIAKGGLIKLAGEAPAGWLDLCAENVFDEERQAAVKTVGQYTLTDTASTGPHTITAGAFYVASSDLSKVYVVSATPNGTTLTLGGTLDVTITAVEAGAAYNLATDSIDQLLTSLSGVTGTNPAGDLESWITTQGADEETDDELVTRCLGKWATLGSGSNDGAYTYWATSTSAEVKRVQVVDLDDGEVHIFIAGSSGGLSDDTVETVSDYIETKRPLGVRQTTLSASTTPVDISGTLRPKDGYTFATIKAKAEAAIDEYFRTLDIGAVVVKSEMIAAAKGAEGVYDVKIDTPTDNISQSTGYVAVPEYFFTQM
jgi:phage-related baseplate assembly protein